MYCVSVAHDTDSGPSGSWLMGPELPAAFHRPQHRLAMLSSSCLVLLLRAIRWHHQAGASPTGLGSEEARLEKRGLAFGREHPQVLMARVLPKFLGKTGDVMTQHARRLALGGTESSGQTCSNPQADAVTAALRDLPWVWILGWPSLLGDLNQFHNFTKPPFPCL